MEKENNISKKKDLELFLNNLKFKYREKFNRELSIEDMLYFCSLYGANEEYLSKHIREVNNKYSKMNLKDYYYMLFKGIYPNKKCSITNISKSKDERITFLEENYMDLLNNIDMEYGVFNEEFDIVDGLNKDDIKYILSAYILPLEDMIYINSEVDKSYVDLTSLISTFSYRYNVSENELSNRLHEVEELTNSKENKRVLKWTTRI